MKTWMNRIGIALVAAAAAAMIAADGFAGEVPQRSMQDTACAADANRDAGLLPCAAIGTASFDGAMS